MEFAKINKDPGNPMPFSRGGSDLKESVIIVDPEKPVKFHAGKILQSGGLEVKYFCEVESALKKISPHWNGILVTHFNTPTLEDLGLLARVRQIDPDLPVLMILDQGDIPLVVKAMREGAYDIIPKTFSKKDILKITLEALEKRRLVLEFRKLQSEIRTSEKPGSFVTGRSRSMEHLRQTLHKASEVDAEVLLVGEAGTGKNMVARCIHDQSPRRHEKFIAIHCSAIPEETLERELFGHEPGAFAGCPHLRIGKFEYAAGGTLYLDKIDCLPKRLQERLLQVLQEGMIERLGSNESIAIDVRIIASTQESLQTVFEQGSFREDLFYQLNMIRIGFPPLREHREDIPIFFRHFVLQACARYQLAIPLITDEIFQDLLRQDWPGNIRELRTAAHNFVLDFDLELPCRDDQRVSVSVNGQVNGDERTLAEKMDAFEKSLIAQELTRTKGNVKETYLTLGLPRKTFYDKLNKHSLKRKDFVGPDEPSNNGSSFHG